MVTLDYSSLVGIVVISVAAGMSLFLGAYGIATWYCDNKPKWDEKKRNKIINIIKRAVYDGRFDSDISKIEKDLLEKLSLYFPKERNCHEPEDEDIGRTE